MPLTQSSTFSTQYKITVAQAEAYLGVTNTIHTTWQYDGEYLIVDREVAWGGSPFPPFEQGVTEKVWTLWESIRLDRFPTVEASAFQRMAIYSDGTDVFFDLRNREHSAP